MAFVTLNGDLSAVTGIYANPQPDIPEYAEIADDDARVLSFLNPPAPAPTFKLGASDFLLRFTSDERAAVRAQPLLADYVMQLQTVRYVDLLDNIVPSAMDALIGLGIIDSTRKTEILNPVLGQTETLVN